MNWKSIFIALGVLNDDETTSITNIIVIVFAFITAFRTLFANLDIHTSWFSWTVQAIDLASTLPMLFGLLNYMHKRNTLNKTDKES